MKWVLILIDWVWPKVNRLDLGSGFDPNRLSLIEWAKRKWVRPMKWILVIIGWVGLKVNELDLGSGFGPNRYGLT